MKINNVFSAFIVLIVTITIWDNVTALKDQSRDPDLIKNGRRVLVGFLQSYQDLVARKPYNKMQQIYPKSQPFFCDAKNGPGKRSKERPTSIHNLRPGDIDVVMAMGDSLTAGHGAAATNLLDIAVENRGMSWSIGGEKDWRTYVTLPNILKEYNQNLYGYSLKSSISTQRESKFNVAEGAAESGDMLYQAKVLRLRLIHDKKVNFEKDWKLLTIFFGAIDFCFHLCYEHQHSLDMHKKDLVNVLRYFRDNIPRVFVNLVAAPDIHSWSTPKKPTDCEYFHIIECDCYKRKSKSFIDRAINLTYEWQKIDDDVANWDEFHTDEFTIVVQPFSKKYIVPTVGNNFLNMEYYSIDCFHFSQKFHKIGAIAVWNNLLEPVGNKSDTMDIYTKLVCPTEERQLLATKINSKINT